MKHITKQNLSDQSKQGTHTKFIEERISKTKNMPRKQPNGQPNPYDRIKSPVPKKGNFKNLLY